MNIKDAERAPVAPGVKVIETVQLAFAASVLPHVVDRLKSVEAAPVSQILRMLREAVPVFDSVTLWTALTIPTFWFPNESDDGLIVTFGTAPFAPVPVRVA